MEAKKKKGKEFATSQSSTLKEDSFQTPSEYQNYLQIVPQKVNPIKCLHDKLLTAAHLPKLLEKYRLIKFLCFKANIYPRMVRMFNANLVIINDKLSCYVMHKQLVINFEVFAKEFNICPTSPKLTIRSFPNHTKDLAIILLFPYSTPKDVVGNS